MLEEFFEEEMNRIGSGFGDVQLLISTTKDETGIPYQSKLSRDLKSILISDKEIEKIEKAFSGRIFLSYRKKDRRYANELMRTIHSIPSLQGVSIWYDEFLSAGEKWSDQIEEALNRSDVFLLMVTPSLMEPDNYVIKEEYPAAKQLKKEITPAFKVYTSAETIDSRRCELLFPGLKVFVNGNNVSGN